jgi:putative transposase
MKYKKQAHCVYYCEYHLVFSTKYRRRIFNEGIFAYFNERLKEIQRHYPELEIIEVNHDEDHVHLLVSIPPKMNVSSAVRIIKTNMSVKLKEKFPFLKKVYWGTDGIWSDGYFVSTVGINEQVIKRYIEMQGAEDTGQAQLELQ